MRRVVRVLAKGLVDVELDIPDKPADMKLTVYEGLTKGREVALGKGVGLRGPIEASVLEAGQRIESKEWADLYERLRVELHRVAHREVERGARAQ